MRLNEIAATGDYSYPGDAENLHWSLTDSGLKSVQELLAGAKDKTVVPDHPDLQIMSYKNGLHMLIAIVNVVDEELIGIFKLGDRRDIARNHYQVDVVGVLPEYRAMRLGKNMYDFALQTKGWILVSGTMQTPDGRRVWFKMASIPHIGVYGLLEMKHITQYNTPHEVFQYYKQTQGVNKEEFNKVLKKYDAGVYNYNSGYVVFMVHPIIGKVHTPHFPVYDKEGHTLLIAKHVG